MLLLSAVMAATLLSHSATALQDTPSEQFQDSPIKLEDLVVEGTQRRQLIDRFVANVSMPATGRQTARWNTRDIFCVGVVNLPGEAARYIADHIGEVARDLNLRVGDPGCRPSVILVASSKPNETAQWMHDNLRTSLAPNAYGLTAGRRAFDNFARSDAPVRWWHVSYITPNAANGTVPGDVKTTNILPDHNITSQFASRILSAEADNLSSVIVIFDPLQLQGLTTRQVADYLTFISLAQVNPEADTEAYDSILNVIAYPSEVSGLTEWDRAYLKGLYAAQRSQKIAGAGRSEIAASIERQAQRIAATN